MCLQARAASSAPPTALIAAPRLATVPTRPPLAHGLTCAQALYSTPEFDEAFKAHGAALLRTSPEDPSNDLFAQMTKLRDGLLTARYANGNEDSAEVSAVCVQPRMFKALVGKGHHEFSSARQQDAQEYFAHLLELIGRAERTASARLSGGSLPPLSAVFQFAQEERIEADGMVCYKPVKGCTQLLLPIPLEAATNRAEHLAYEERASLAKRQKLENP